MDLEKFNGTLVLTNESALINEDIEMQPMNSTSRTQLTSPAWQDLHRPPDCCPKFILKQFSFCAKIIPQRFQQRWTYLRSQAHRLVEHRFFEWLIIGSILASSTTLVSYFKRKENVLFSSKKRL
jgi:hypothetical protein